MFKIEKKPYGYHITLEGFIQEEEANDWLQESRKILLSAPKDFCVFVNMMDLKPMSAESSALIEQGQKEFKLKGLKRSVVVLANPITKMQFKRVAKQSGIYEWERYLDVASTSDYESVGEKWLVEGIDPDA